LEKKQNSSTWNKTMPEQTDIQYFEVANEDELPVNERIFLEMDSQPLVIINLAGKLYAIGDVCSHDNGPLGDGEIVGFEIVCPRHGARFDIRSGKAARSPAFRDIPSYSVKVENGKIYLGKNPAS
jgi:3-phenylpropionate/trans-cinnamate dioxygenase ferredoxin component